MADGVGISAPGRQPCPKLKVENLKSNSAAVTEYVRQAALPCDWALKSPAFVSLCRSEKVQCDSLEIFPEGWTFCSHFVLVRAALEDF
ncbi:hypothetical protein [Bradyrhizobium sp. RP6]|uniref:hypothetical protein n=1 Tax=Bradyrhizobium sp. RP6 TaxID=2489596 RepID=UPI000F52FFBB|nr:hypothetical protein [Bradyrhizobium sp. RP6]RQH11678.1 hypothetical protein EHH60_18285 [Bradyrhizobium sp. RP6]